MHRPITATSAAASVACALVIVCGPGCGTRGADPGIDPVRGKSTAAFANIDTLVCGATTASEADGGARTKVEWYSLTALNALLQNSEGFRQFAGVGEVQTCPEARLVSAAYDDYELAHPGFSADLPELRTSRPLPAELTSVPDTLEPKVLQGTPGQLGPVVKITNKIGTCTGTFIARHWVLTAAHCLEPIIDVTEFGTPVDSGLQGYAYDYLISYFSPKFDSNGNPVQTGQPVQWLPRDVSQTLKVLQYVHPKFRGYNPSTQQTTAGQYDVALLYIPRAYDSLLTANALGSGASYEPWMRLSLSGIPTSQSIAWGVGAGDDPVVNTLESTGFGQAFPFTLVETLVSGTVGPNGPFLCHGDSGGPVVDMAVVNSDPWFDPTSATPSKVPLLVDITDLILDPGLCAQTNRPIVTLRVDRVTEFIQNSMRDWYTRSFSCTTGTSNLGSFLQCWGSLCNPTLGCPQNFHCDGPPVMGAPGGCSNAVTCGPLNGQCLPDF